jgi:hypothetical protein
MARILIAAQSTVKKWSVSGAFVYRCAECAEKVTGKRRQSQFG